METFSQANQDMFPQLLLRKVNAQKTYLDIGCHEPTIFNNSYALERAGWKGISIDIQDYSNQFAKLRSNPFLKIDVTKVDWTPIIEQYFPSKTIDYISFDVDDATKDAVRNFPFHDVRFKTMTIEHDGYRVGTTLRDSLRTLFSSYGYTLICGDVVCEGYGAFEDWWVDLSQVDEVIATKLISTNVASKIIKNSIQYLYNEN